MDEGRKSRVSRPTKNSSEGTEHGHKVIVEGHGLNPGIGGIR